MNPAVRAEREALEDEIARAARLKRQIADDTRVAVEFTAHGTHKGPLMTPTGALPATGKSVVFTVCEVWDFRDGKISGIRNYQDAASILRQLGVA